MGMVTNLLVIFFCILFFLYVGQPGTRPAFLLLFGEGRIDFMSANNLLMSAMTLGAAVVAGILTHDIMTGIVAGIAMAFANWFLIPAEFTAGMPEPIALFISGVLMLMWSLAVIGFFRGYEP